jgi:hypothetical protein
LIPDEAVEAAARALDPYTMGIDTATNAEHRQAVRQEVIRVLEAAAPHMLAVAWDEGCADGGWNTNPYRAATARALEAAAPHLKTAWATE